MRERVGKLKGGLSQSRWLVVGTEHKDEARQVANCAQDAVTEQLAKKRIPRVRQAGIEIALVDGRGNVTDVTYTLRPSTLQSGQTGSGRA